MCRNKNIIAQNIVIFITSIITFALIGELASLFFSKTLCKVLGIIVGIITGILFIILRPHNPNYHSDNNDNKFTQTLDEYTKQCYYEIKLIYSCRRFAAKRLMWSEFWIQTINIYYSIFTAILAVFSLTPNNDFLQIPSVIFTITVAILVTYANAQKCESRSKDLTANCSDLGKRYTEILSFINSYANIDKDYSSHKQLKEKMELFYCDLGDSEEHSIVDEWKYTDSWLYYLYISGTIIFVSILILVPIGFIGKYYTEFVAIFNTNLLSDS